jgi:hypothetical protein
MKASLYLLLTCIIFLSTSCSKEDIGPKLKRETTEKIVGKWMLDREIYEVYSPSTTLMSTAEYVGISADFYVFKTNQIVSLNSVQSGSYEVPYQVLNPNQIIVGQTVWRIQQLTTNELALVLHKNDAGQDKSFVTKVYLRR